MEVNKELLDDPEVEAVYIALPNTYIMSGP